MAVLAIAVRPVECPCGSPQRDTPLPPVFIMGLTELPPGKLPCRMPPAPSTTDLREQAARRARAICIALPMLARDRILLERTWRSDDPDAVPIYAASGNAVHVHAAGAQRLSSVLADEHALLLELKALRELMQALDIFDGGGSAAMHEVDGFAVLVRSSMLSHPLNGGYLVPRTEKAFTAWMLRYLCAVIEELWVARKQHDVESLAELSAEREELLARIQTRARGRDNGTGGGASSAPSIADALRSA